jgi:hypothetical protein
MLWCDSSRRERNLAFLRHVVIRSLIQCKRKKIKTRQPTTIASTQRQHTHISLTMIYDIIGQIRYRFCRTVNVVTKDAVKICIIGQWELDDRVRVDKNVSIFCIFAVKMRQFNCYELRVAIPCVLLFALPLIVPDHTWIYLSAVATDARSR